MQLLARTLRNLAQRFLADPYRAQQEHSNQHTARTNAAKASATLRKRRGDYDDAQEYLLAQRQTHPAPNLETDRDGDGTERAV